MIPEYFFSRNSSRIGSDLQHLAGREIQTLENLIRIYDSSYRLESKFFVDVGCGDMYLRESVESRGANYFGFDIEECNLLKDPMPLDSSSADLLGCYSVIEHLADPSNLLKEAYRVIRPDGYFLIETPNWNFCKNSFYNDYTHVKPYTTNGLRTLINDFGFELLNISPNVRCKPNYFFTSEFRFQMARWLPFRGFGGVFSFLKGRSTGIFLLARKK